MRSAWTMRSVERRPYPRCMGLFRRLAMTRQRHPFFGDCHACGHDWREHMPPATDGNGPCSECVYEIEHEEPGAPVTPCKQQPLALPLQG